MPDPTGRTEEGLDQTARARRGTVLVVEDDPAIGGLVQAVLLDEGYAVSVLSQLTGDAVRTAVGRLEPDCVLLDSIDRGGD
ncbi:MAG TPA: hypothetical protein VFN74_06285 [Chloroflexota bacterium]|nr:hypothetical protein [Chloroflexota bacterium]